MIEIKNLTKKFENETALDNVSLKFETGKIYGLLGPNSSGKTTLIKLLNDLLIPTRGEILINGFKPGENTKKIVSFMPDEINMLGKFTASDAIYWYEYFFEDFDKEKAINLSEKFKIDLSKRINSLSKGSIEKLSLLLTLSRRAKIFILDEPLGGVDPSARESILNMILSEFDPDSLMIVSTHLISDIEPILDEVIFLKEGKVILEDSADNLRSKNNESINDTFKRMFKE